MNINKIVLNRVLPNVFQSVGEDSPVNRSQVWRQEIEFSRGKRYLIEAESGTGKSSMCSFIYGNRTDYSGTIMFNDKDIRGLSIKDWCAVRCNSIAYLPQEMALFPELTALENIEIKNRLTHNKTREQIVIMLERLEIGDKINSRAAHLSIGQQQRVAIVRALCQPFDFLLLDEPVSHLDSRNNNAVAELIKEELDATGAGMIATSVGNKINIETNNIFLL
jgi:ABC-type lipoprotein export system ATPase subunit